MTIASRAAKIGITSFLIVILILAGSGGANAKQLVDAQLKVGPEPKFPMIATWLGLEGHCEVRFSVDENGLPFAITPSCTRPIFCFEAKRAISETVYEPKTIDGIPAIRTKMVFPLSFYFAGSGYVRADDPRPLELCEKHAVS